MTEQNVKEKKFSDYLSIIYNWRKFFLINMIVIIILSTIYSFLIPKTYKATATLTLSSSSGSGLGNIGSLLSNGNSALSLGAKLFGVTSTNEDVILGILNSKFLLSKVINKYKLIDYYSVGDSSIDRTIKLLKGDLILDINEFGFIEVNAIHESPDTAAMIVNFMSEVADSINVELNIEQARRNRIFIEERYLRNKKELKEAEEKFKEFQQEYGVFAVEEQIQIAVAAAGELEAQLFEKQILLNTLKSQMSDESYLVKTVRNEIEAIKTQLKNINKKVFKGDAESLLIPFDQIPDLQIKYIRLYREVEIQNKILEFIYPLYEQALMEENKSVPSLIALDAGIPPDMKYAPKKAFVILGISFVFFFILLFMIIRGDYTRKMSEPKNSAQHFEKRFYKRLTDFYKISFKD